MKDLGILNLRDVSHEDASKYKLREAARAIVLDEKGDVALLHVTRDGYYKLPGGGIDEGEDRLTALKRECREEIGCDIEIVGEVGFTTEYWREDQERQISYCYLAKLSGVKGEPTLTENEIKRGFETVWIPYNKALEFLRTCTPAHWEGENIVPREILFLEAAMEQFPVRKALLFPINSKKEIFIQDRRGHKKPDWGFFGGSMEGDETPLQALIRESEEELSIDISEPDVRYLGVSVTNWEGALIVRHLYAYPTDQIKFDVREGAGGHWMSFAQARTHMDDKDRFDEVVERIQSA